MTFSESRRYLTLHNITSDLTMTVQCNGTNVHGSAVANFYINVHGEQKHFACIPKKKYLCSVMLINLLTFHFLWFASSEPTIITMPPSDVILREQKIIEFKCMARTDPGLPLAISWYRGQNSRPIIDEKNRIYIDAEYSLVLNLTNEEDDGRSFIASYTCVASNGITSANASARLRPASDVPLEGLVGPLLAINGPFPSSSCSFMQNHYWTIMRMA